MEIDQNQDLQKFQSISPSGSDLRNGSEAGSVEDLVEQSKSSRSRDLKRMDREKDHRSRNKEHDKNRTIKSSVIRKDKDVRGERERGKDKNFEIDKAKGRGEKTKEREFDTERIREKGRLSDDDFYIHIESYETTETLNENPDFSWDRDKTKRERSKEEEDRDQRHVTERVRYKKEKGMEKDFDVEKGTDRSGSERKRERRQSRDQYFYIDEDREKSGDRDRRREKRGRSREKYFDVDKGRELSVDRDRKRDRRERVRERDYDFDQRRERSHDRDTDRGMDQSKEKVKDRDRDREKRMDRVKENGEKEREPMSRESKYMDNDRGMHRDPGWGLRSNKEMEMGRVKNEKVRKDREEHLSNEDAERRGNRFWDKKMGREEDVFNDAEDDDTNVEQKEHLSHEEVASNRPHAGPLKFASELEEHISKMREERLLRKHDVDSDVLSRVSRVPKPEKTSAETLKAMQLSKALDEQENIEEGCYMEEEQLVSHNLAGVKVLHGLEKAIEGGAVIMTLKDQDVLANGDINDEMDVLENVEIAEQKRRNDAYRAAKANYGIQASRFSDDVSSQKTILPQYDEPPADEGVVLDHRGKFSGEAERKLEELRRRLTGAPSGKQFEDLYASGKSSSDYYTQEEMLQFKKPKKKKSLRKKEKLDIDALEAEAVSAGLGVGDLGAKNVGRRQTAREEQERQDTEMRNKAYQLARAKAEEALRDMKESLSTNKKEDKREVFLDDDEELQESLERARKIALEKQGNQHSDRIVSSLATDAANAPSEDNRDGKENKIVFTEMEEFVWGLQLDQETQKRDNIDVFKEKDEEAPRSGSQSEDEKSGGWRELNNQEAEEKVAEEERAVPDETIHETAVGKGLSGALKLLKDRGTLKESVEWGGRNMDKKKSKLVGIMDEDADSNRFKDIHIERTDEFGRILTPKEAFRIISHKFHGKGPGKMKQEKRMKQYQEDLKLKQMKNSDTPTLSVERMIEAQSRLKTPYLVLSGQVKPGQTSDPKSGFATADTDVSGGMTPMLGDKKVEHFLGLNR